MTTLLSRWQKPAAAMRPVPGPKTVAATGTVQDAVIGAWTSADEGGTWDVFDFLSDTAFPGLAIERRRSQAV